MNNQIKVFLSSTFEDMQNEREHLVKKIFPAIKTECERRDVEFSVVDLRWGISEEQSSPGKIIDICLNEIDGSHPFFIGLVGNRYGTIWSREQLKGDEEILRRRPWVKPCLEDGMSITEMEMQYGVFDKTDEVHAFFYIKKTKWYRRKGETRGTMEEKLLKQKKLGKLIDKIDDFAEQGKVKAERYSSSSQLGTIVYKQMMEMLDKLYPVIKDDSEMDRLARTQKAWMRELCKIYFDDKRVKNVEELLDGTYKRPSGVRHGYVLCKHVSVSGEQGAGKSTLLANLCKEKKNYFYIKICDEVNDSTQLLELLKHMVEKVGLDYTNDPIFCAIDDSEKLTVDTKSFEYWLRDELPENIRVIYSRSGHFEPNDHRYRTATYNEKTHVYVHYIADYEVKGLGANEMSKLIEGILANNAKGLIERKKDHIGNNPLFHTPGMLRLLLNEMVQYGSYEHIDSFTDKYLLCKDRTEFFDCMLQRMEDDYGKETVQRLMGLLALIPIGLPSEDLRDYLHITRLEWVVLNEVLSEFLNLRLGMLVLDSVDMRNAVQRRYMSDVSFVNGLRRDAIILLRKERKRREPKLWDKKDKANSVIRILGSIILLRFFKYIDFNDSLYKQVNDALVDQYIALDMKRDIQREYLDGLAMVGRCSNRSILNVSSYMFDSPDYFAYSFSSSFILLLYLTDYLEATGRSINSNQPKVMQDRIVKHIRSRWLVPAFIKNKIIENIQKKHDYNSIDYFCSNCNYGDLEHYIQNDIFYVDDDHIKELYDKAKIVLASDQIDDNNKLCLYNLVAAYCFYRLGEKGDNHFYYKALELDELEVIVSRTLFPFILGEREENVPLLTILRKYTHQFKENSAQRITAEINLAKAEFIDAIAPSYYPGIRVSDATDDVLSTDDDWRLPVERLFAEQDISIAGYNKYDLACEFARLAYVKGEQYRAYAAWAYSFAYRLAENTDQRVSCLLKIRNVISNISKPKLCLQILEKISKLLLFNNADSFFVYSTMLSKVDVYKECYEFDDAIKAADEAYSYFDKNRESIDEKAWCEYAYARALESIWYKQFDKFGTKHLLDKAYIHYDIELKLEKEKERDWYIARLNRDNVLVEICQTYGFIPKGERLDSALSGYKELLSEIRIISEEKFNNCLKNYCFLLLRADRTEEALNMFKENRTCHFYTDDCAFLFRKEGDIGRSEFVMNKVLHGDIVPELDSYGYFSHSHGNIVFDDLNNSAHTTCYLLRDYKEFIYGRRYFTFQMLVEYAKNNKPLPEPKYESRDKKPENMLDWQVARHVILLLNALCVDDKSEQEKAYSDAMQYLLFLYMEYISLAPIFPLLMLMSKINLKEKHQNTPTDTLLWFKDIYKTLVEETGEESDYIEWDLSYPFISLQSFLDDDSSEFGGLKHLIDVNSRLDENWGLDHFFRNRTLNQWNRLMEKENDALFKKYAYKFIRLHKETSFMNDGIFEKLINILINEDSRDEAIYIVDYCINYANFAINSSLRHFAIAMINWGETKRLLRLLDVMLEKSKDIVDIYEGCLLTSFVRASGVKSMTLNALGKNEEAYKCAMRNRKKFEDYKDSDVLGYEYDESWYFYFYAGKSAMLSGHLHDAMDFFTKELEVINKIQYAVNNNVKTMENVYTQDEVDSYKIDNGCMIAICMLKQGNIEDGKRHFAEHVEPLLSDADADNDNVKLYQETLSKLA